MSEIARLRRELDGNAWANRESMRSLRAAAEAPARAAEVMAHIVGAEWLWLRRIGHAAPSLPVWPSLALSECGAHLEALAPAWRVFLDGLSGDSLRREVAYTNTKGERWTNTVEDILTHVVLHSSYHRGQIASLLRGAGEVPAYTDYIECVRRGFLDRDGPA